MVSVETLLNAVAAAEPMSETASDGSVAATIKEENEVEPTIAHVQMISPANTVPVYDFFEIDKCFPPSNPHEVMGGGDEQRLIPIYVCRPLKVREVVRMTPLQKQQADVLKELAKLDEMEIEVILAPPPSSIKGQRKTKLISRAMISSTAKNPDEHVAEKKESSDVTEVPSIEVKSEIAAEDFESPETPKFQCGQCDARFYMKKALLSHGYYHK